LIGSWWFRPRETSGKADLQPAITNARRTHTRANTHTNCGDR